LAGAFAASEAVFLEEILALDLPIAYGEGELAQKVRSELDIRFARSKHFIQSMIWLHGADCAAIPEIPGKTLAHEFATVSDVLTKLFSGGFFQHLRIRKIDHRILADVGKRHEVGLNVVIEEGLISALRRLHVVGGYA